MRERLRVSVRGAVQGVGFRPFVYRLARELALDGFVQNTPGGVAIEVEGARDALDACLLRLERERPPRAFIHGLEASWLDCAPHDHFEIRPSEASGALTAVVLADIATCDDCRRELFDPGNRRYRYPFVNCTNCGPRFSIIEAMPYDRARTSMRAFTMCGDCAREYHDPDDRRFHAQPNACPACGPRVRLCDGAGAAVAKDDEALHEVAAAIRGGAIVAVKGLGGFHLVVDAGNPAAIGRLRARKHREEKPFAVMFPCLSDVRRGCVVSEAEARLLESPECPIVLVRRRHPAGDAGVDADVAPGNPYLGVMLPYTPLHHLLLADVGAPVVATSGNLSEEPIAIDDEEARRRLAGIADLFLIHDRPIVRHVDDSIACVALGRELVMRRARGYAPLPVPVAHPLPPIVAVGGHQKSTVALTVGSHVVISQHLGDLGSGPSAAAFKTTLDDLVALHDAHPEAVAVDLHPDYVSTRHAATLGLPVVGVQHHHAHVLSCMAENELDGPVLGVSWDGTGFGPDGTVWGGEFLVCDGTAFTRVGCLRPFRLPGGERAVREPRRAAFGLLHAMLGPAIESGAPGVWAAFTAEERRLLLQALARGLNAPVTSSAGRLFDAVAACVGLRMSARFEAQAAMELEFVADETIGDAYPFRVAGGTRYDLAGTGSLPAAVIDWEPSIRALLADVAAGVSPAVMSGRFHHTLARMIVAAACEAGESRVVLSGGCFQNRLLLARAVTRLREAGFRVYWHQRVPPNDGGLSLGQAVIGARMLAAGHVGLPQ